MNINRIHQRGISLIEVILSMCIISAILIMATRYFYTASNNQSVNQTVSEIASVVVALQNWDQGNSDFSGLATNGILSLYQAGFLPETIDLVVSENSGNITAVLNNAWVIPIVVVGQVGSVTISTGFNNAAECAAVQAHFANSQCDASHQFTYVLQE